METITYENLNENIKMELLEAEKAAKEAFPEEKDTKVGAILISDEKKYIGTNIIRQRSSDSTCAERMAIDKALFDNVKKINRIVIIGINEESPFEEVISPCGECRQIIFEALNRLEQSDIEIILSNSNKTKIVKTNLKELLPLAYESPKQENC